MNVNYYAPVPEDGVSEPSGIGAHNDYEAFAMLWQDGVKGLQISPYLESGRLLSRYPRPW